MVVLGLITARGGSKSIPNKNLLPLLGQPLLDYTCRAASAAKTLSRIVLSTDDPAIAAAGRRCGVEVPFVRPAELAQDTTPSIAVALHALDWLGKEERWEPEVLILLQPTSPLRTARHIDEALELLEKSNAETVVSVLPVPHRYSPYSIMELAEGRLVDFWKQPLPFDRFRRQNLPVLYARNGPAVLATKVTALRREKGFYGASVIPYVMSEEDSVDIDTMFDARVAEAVLSMRMGGQS